MDLHELRTLFNDDMLRVRPRIENFPWHDAGAYALYMKQTEYFTGHSPRILGGVAERFPAGHEMHERFASHTKEETGHDQLATRDIVSLGFNPDELPVMRATRRFIDAQYRWLASVSPYSIFGWILLLETCAAEIAPGIVNVLIEAHGKARCKFLILHAFEDPDHIAKAWAMLESVPDGTMELIWGNYCQSADNYLSIFEEVVEYAARATTPA